MRSRFNGNGEQNGGGTLDYASALAAGLGCGGGGSSDGEEAFGGMECPPVSGFQSPVKVRVDSNTNSLDFNQYQSISGNFNNYSD